MKNGLADVKGTVRNDHRLPERVIQKYTQCIGYIIYVISVEKFKEPKAEVDNLLVLQEAQLSQIGRAMHGVTEDFAVTQSNSRLFEFTPLSKACV